MKKVYTVYKTTNLINGKIYIGVHKTTNPNDSYLGSGLHIKNAIKKYGRENFNKEILAIFDNIHEAYKKERELVTQEFIKRNDTYNLATGGSISPDRTEERNIFYKERFKGENHPMFGKKHKKKSKERISKSLVIAFSKISKTDKEKWWEKRSINVKGKPSPLKGRKQTLESNIKRSEAHKNLPKKECPHCLMMISPQNAKRFHFNNCKKKL